MKTFLLVSNIVLLFTFICTIGFGESYYYDDENYVYYLIFLILSILIILSNLIYLILSNKDLVKLKKERRKLEEEIKIKKLKNELEKND
jgi:hypothetical protein